MMKASRRATLFSVIVAAAACLALAAPESPRPMELEGSKWVVRVTPDAAALKKGEQAFKDTISFGKGQVEMSECVKYGFAASPYSVKKKGARWEFKTEQKSEKGDLSVWDGQISGEKITGTMVWTKRDGTVLHYSVQGAKNKGM